MGQLHAAGLQCGSAAWAGLVWLHACAMQLASLCVCLSAMTLLHSHTSLQMCGWAQTPFGTKFVRRAVLSANGFSTTGPCHSLDVQALIHYGGDSSGISCC